MKKRVLEANMPATAQSSDIFNFLFDFVNLLTRVVQFIDLWRNVFGQQNA